MIVCADLSVGDNYVKCFLSFSITCEWIWMWGFYAKESIIYAFFFFINFLIMLYYCPVQCKLHVKHKNMVPVVWSKHRNFIYVKILVFLFYFIFYNLFVVICKCQFYQNKNMHSPSLALLFDSCPGLCTFTTAIRTFQNMWLKLERFVERVKAWWISHCFQGSPS